MKSALIIALALFGCAGEARAEKIKVKDAEGRTTTMEKSRSFGECVRKSLKLGYPKDGAERYCEKWFRR